MRTVLAQVGLTLLAVLVVLLALPWLSGNNATFNNRVDNSFSNFVEKF